MSAARACLNRHAPSEQHLQAMKAGGYSPFIFDLIISMYKLMDQTLVGNSYKLQKF